MVEATAQGQGPWGGPVKSMREFAPRHKDLACLGSIMYGGPVCGRRSGWN